MRWTRQAQSAYALTSITLTGLVTVASLATSACGSATDTDDSAAAATTQATGGATASSKGGAGNAASGMTTKPAAGSGGAGGTSETARGGTGGTAKAAANSGGSQSKDPAAPSGGSGGSQSKDPAASSGGSGGSQSTDPAASSGGAGAAGAAGGTAATSGGKADPTGSGIPCDVFQALANSCQVCHGRVPSMGAPMALVEIADFRVLSVSTPKIPKSELALMRIDGSRRPSMPPEGWQFTDQDKKTLIDWLSAGAPEATADNATCP